MAPFVRKDVWNLDASDPIITYYAKAVAAMKAKPESDFSSWTYQAAIFGTDKKPSRPGWNKSRRGGAFFLPWNRMYLYHFERIVRAQVIALGGPSDWALPFWNFDHDGNHNQLPLAFRSPTVGTNEPNPLYMHGRELTGSKGIHPVGLSEALLLVSESFYQLGGGGESITKPGLMNESGNLEAMLNDSIERQVGGAMKDPRTAALDPIFWLHKCNIDRLWWQWQLMHPAPPFDPATISLDTPTYPGMSLPVLIATFSFLDADGTKRSKRVWNVNDPVAQLNYTYSPH